ncbi:hypothetical protein RFI_17532 [Reticulomyxa filosa]|uniref:Uncharacterized protein n=1 Tax=Reticulomyxa filosa TaxID=46433 RepID=X6N095_RETFI|nr:hypothetical protein RFI_17532 [Reticulomyxa filosa]|eukprot:ETO19700.1 hypothetical protein RFI_17532 [Reticulomyxa filosa]
MRTKPRFGPTGLFGLPIVWSCAVGVIVPPAIFLLFGTEKVEQKHWAEKSSPYFDYRGEKVGYHDYLKSHGKKHLLSGADAHHGHGHGHDATEHHEHAKEEEEAHPEEKVHEEETPEHEIPKTVETSEIKTSSFPEEVPAKVPEGKPAKVELKDHNPVKEEESRGYPVEPKTPIPEKDKEKEKEKPKKGHH